MANVMASAARWERPIIGQRTKTPSQRSGPKVSTSDDRPCYHRPLWNASWPLTALGRGGRPLLEL